MKSHRFVIPCLILPACVAFLNALPALAQVQTPNPPPEAGRSTAGMPGSEKSGPFTPTLPEGRASYRVSVRSVVLQSIPGETPEEIKADTDFCYTWERQGNERVLTMDSIQIHVVTGGTVAADSFMGLDRWLDRKSGEDLGPSKMPDVLREVLQNSFGKKSYKVCLDEGGNVISKQRLLPDASASLIHSGILANALFFHVRFPEEQNRWEVSNALCLKDDTLVSGPLTYEKGPAGKDRRVPVLVTGTLKTGVRKATEKPEITVSVVHEVSGEQFYDLDLREWVSGKLKFKTTISVESRELSQKLLGEGTLNVSLEKLPQPQTGPAPWPAD